MYSGYVVITRDLTMGDRSRSLAFLIKGDKMAIYQKMEKLDKVRLRATTGICMIGIGVIIFFISMGIFQNVTGSNFGFFLGVAGGFVLRGTHGTYKKIYKDLFVEEPLQRNFDDVFYAWRSGFSLDEMNSFGLCRNGNKIASEDYIRAGYKGINFEMADVCLKDITKSGKSGEDIMFNGRMLVFDYPGKKVGTTRIYSDAFYYLPKDDITKNNKVEMESDKFNQIFRVYAENPHDAFYLLTPHFMETLLRLQKKYANIGIRFCGNKVVVGLNDRGGKDSFDKSDWTNKVIYPEEMARIQGDIDDIKTIIDTICFPEAQS